MTTTFSEDVILFNALTPSITDIKFAEKALKIICERKKEIDPSDRFNVLLYLDEGPSYLEEFTPDLEHVHCSLKDLSGQIKMANIAGGIFTAITTSIEVFKQVPDKCFRIIIFVDSGTMEIPLEYILILQNLIDIVYTIPLFIDVIFFNFDNAEEDFKLSRLARRSGGDVKEINDMKKLTSILEIIGNKKQSRPNSLVSGKNLEIPIAFQPFYEKIAEDVIKIEGASMCSICHEKDDNELVQCPNCLMVGHKNCYANWAKTTYYGMKNVFRCPSCFYLLKLDKEYMKSFLSLKKDIKHEKIGVKKFLESYQLQLKPDMKNIQEPMEVVVIKPDTMPFPKDSKKAPSVRAKRKDLKTVFCPNCGKIITSAYKECPHCYFPLF